MQSPRRLVSEGSATKAAPCLSTEQLLDHACPTRRWGGVNPPSKVFAPSLTRTSADDGAKKQKPSAALSDAAKALMAATRARLALESVPTPSRLRT